MSVAINLLNQLNQKSQRRSGGIATDVNSVLEDLDEGLDVAELEKNIEFHFEQDQLKPAFLENLRNYLSELSFRYSKRFIELLEESSETLLTQEIIDYILEHGYDYPRIDIYYGDQAEEKFIEFRDNYRRYKIQQHSEQVRKAIKNNESVPAELDEWELNEEQDFIAWPTIDSDHVFVVFNIPAPLAYFWWKYSRGKNGVQGSFIEWGDYYYKLQNEVVYKMKTQANASGLKFDSLNHSGVHLYNEFFYMWDMYPNN